jgi:uncharacterized protein
MSEVNVLTITGGGIRGYITLQMLVDLESKLKRPLYSYFDYIGGTSTGAIIAAMLSVGHTAKEVVEYYEKLGPAVFKSRFWRPGVFGLPKYSDRELNKNLRQVFGKMKMSEALTNLVIPSYNISDRSKYIFKSYSKQGTEDTIFDAVRSSASAPSYFRPHTISGDMYIDGGLVINNPSQLVFTEALYAIRRNKGTKINVFSFGTGRKDTEIKLPKTGGGKVFWVKPSVEILLNEQSRTTDYFMNRLYQTKDFGTYLNIEPHIDLSSNKIDDASEVNMVSMLLDGQNSATYHARNIQKIVKILDNEN